MYLCPFLKWFQLEDVPHGEVHLKLQWFALKADSSLLTEVTSLLFIYLHLCVHYVSVVVALITGCPSVQTELLQKEFCKPCVCLSLQMALLVQCLQCILTARQTCQ